MDDLNVMDDPEGGCIVQAEDPQMLAVFDGAAPSGNNSWYWTSLLKLNMEQGPAPSSMSSTHSNINSSNLCVTGAHFTHDSGQHQATDQTPPAPASASSPSSSSVHDQPTDMLAQNNAFNASDPDSSVWGQEFLSGPIGENKISNILNDNQLACSDDGLHELLYPRTVLELLFSDQLKLEQMPSWPDILQQTVSAGGPGKPFGFPPASDKIMAGSAHDINNVNNMDNPQLDIKFPPQYLHNYAHFSGMDDRFSSSTAGSTLSDNATIDQWAPTGSSSGQPENVQAHPPLVMHSSPLSSMQQVDHTRVKQEYLNVPSPPFGSNENMNNLSSNYMHHQPQNQSMVTSTLAAGNGSFSEALMSHVEYEQKPSLIRKLWTPALINAIDPLTIMNHKHHIYESITQANFSHNLRQAAGLNANGYNLQTVNNNGGGDLHARIIPAPGAAAALHNYITQPSQQLAKKSRPFHEYAAAASTGAQGSTAHEVVEARKDQVADEESKTSSAMGAEGAANMLALHMSCNNKQQLSGAEYNFKRSRIEQPRGPSPPSASTTTTTTTNSSSSSFKSQPVRKEKLTERITTLQQLVSPFGKTDTASVLLEAIGYIKFLQEQVQALSSPYFKSPNCQNVERNHNGDEGKPDLRSRGLCLVPLSCTMQVANDNGADYWYGGAFR